MKNKARILLENACSLIGVIDDKGILEEGEVYVQICPNPTDQIEIRHYTKPSVITGKVVVTRSPCLHPGDVRLLKAVDKQELSHLVNVIVFSSKGSVPEQNEMAGGDLDGDIYQIIWEKEIVNYLAPAKFYEALQKEELINNI